MKYYKIANIALLLSIALITNKICLSEEAEVKKRGLPLWQFQCDCYGFYEEVTEVPLAISFSSDSNLIACQKNREINIWNWQEETINKNLSPNKPIDPNAEIFTIAFSPDNKYLAVGGRYDYYLQVWDLKKDCIIFSSGGYSGTVSFDDLPSMSFIGGTEKLMFTPDSQFLIGQQDFGIRVWNVKGRSEVFTFYGNYSTFSMSSCGKYVALVNSSDNHESIVIYSFDTKKKIYTCARDHEQPLFDICFLSDNESIAYTSKNHFKIVNWKTDTELLNLKLDGYIWNFQYSPQDELFFLTVNKNSLSRDLRNKIDTYIAIYDMKKKQIMMQYDIGQLFQQNISNDTKNDFESSVYISSCFISPDGQYITILCNNGMSAIFRVKDIVIRKCDWISNMLDSSEKIREIKEFWRVAEIQKIENKVAQRRLQMQKKQRQESRKKARIDRVLKEIEQVLINEWDDQWNDDWSNNSNKAW